MTGGDLIILGAGGTSREIAEMIASSPELSTRWSVRGFLDDAAERAGSLVDGVPVLGRLDDAHAHPGASFVVGIASHRDPLLRKKIVERLRLSPERFTTLVHPSSFVSSRAHVGFGTVVMQNVAVTTGATIGSHVLLSPGVQIAHDSSIADYTVLAPRATINGNVRIGECVYIGAAAVIAPNVVAAPGALVGIGTVVTRNVGAGSTVFGNPSRVINTGALRRWTP
jgi:sugar O-acyltransferase (sialic acid O-acetyltransferase NeuD family)